MLSLPSNYGEVLFAQVTGQEKFLGFTVGKGSKYLFQALPHGNARMVASFPKPLNGPGKHIDTRGREWHIH